MANSECSSVEALYNEQEPGDMIGAKKAFCTEVFQKSESKNTYFVPAPALTCSYASPQRTVLFIESRSLERTNGLKMCDALPAKAHDGILV